VFFGGSNFAAYDTGGFIRALNYATIGGDTNTVDVGSITIGKHVKLTATPGSSQAAISLLSLNLAGSGVSWTTTSGNLQAPGIIKSGGGTQSTISGGNLTGGGNTELVIRTDTVNDSLLISSNLVQGTGALTKSGAGTLTLSGSASTYTGQTYVNGGTLSIGSNINLGAVTTGATLNLRGGTLQSTGTFALDNAGATKRAVVLTYLNGIDVTGSNTLTVSGVVSGTGSLTKSNTGTLALTGTNTYSGATYVTNGTLAVNGTGSINSSAVTVNGGNFRYNSTVAYTGTLTYTSGTIGGTNLGGSFDNQTIGTGKTISPGNSPGTASTGSQTWAGGGTYVWEVNNAQVGGVGGGTAGADPGWDLENGTGTLTISATSGSQFNLLLTSLSLGNTAGLATNFDKTSNYNWLIADFASVTGFAANAFNINTSAFTNTFTGTFGVATGDMGTIGGDSSQIYLTYTAVPEPGAALIGSLGLLALLRRRRN
jgi:autotransporter-associated beta strand protein